jgi:nitroreductase
LFWHLPSDLDAATRAVMFNNLSSPAALLATRRSGKPRDMIAPGPSVDQLRSILESATRVPDHGKLAPWRFIVIAEDQRDALSELLTSAYRSEKPDAGRLEIEAMDQFARQAPCLVVALSTPVIDSKIPVWEQELSVGAACMQLLNAVHAQGFVGGWLTGWPAYSGAVRAAFGGEYDRIAGFIFIGTPGRAQEERPRPDHDSVVQSWTAPQI